MILLEIISVYDFLSANCIDGDPSQIPSPTNIKNYILDKNQNEKSVDPHIITDAVWEEKMNMASKFIPLIC